MAVLVITCATIITYSLLWTAPCSCLLFSPHIKWRTTSLWGGALRISRRKNQHSSSYTTNKNSNSGLSKFHQRLLSFHSKRQRFVTGKYPLLVSVQNCPTRRWLGKSTSQLLVNGTAVESSVASYERLSWLDADDDDEDDDDDILTMELIAEISYSRKPAYIHLIPSSDTNKKNTQVLWASHFSLTSRYGRITSFDTATGSRKTIPSLFAWPNEIRHCDDDALLVSDGFLVPGKDKGGIYVVLNPGQDGKERKICISGEDEQNIHWFYHRAIWIDLTRDGRQSILTARSRRPNSILSSASISIPTSSSTAANGAANSHHDSNGSGQLIFLERPKPHHYDDRGIPRHEDNTLFDPFSSRNTPWKLRVLDDGPDVMFSVADMDPTDNSVEVIACQFFGKKLSIHSIEKGEHPKVTFRKIIDDRCGASFSSALVNLEETATSTSIVMDSGCTTNTLMPGDLFSHILVTSHECKFDNNNNNEDDKTKPTKGFNIQMGWQTNSIDGGSLFAYKVPTLDWKTEEWTRTLISTGFRVNGQLGNMINPGAPGFVYTFYSSRAAKEQQGRPLIGISGDCAEAAYFFRPRRKWSNDPTHYELMCEIDCGATVGSLAIGYENFCGLPQQSNFAKLYIPCYEKEKILVFALGDGSEDEEEMETIFNG